MGIQTNQDFASLLDDLIASSQIENDTAARPSIPFDYLSVVEELHSGRIRVSSEDAAAEYRETAGDPVDALFAAVAAAPEDLPTDQQSIESELDLGRARTSADLARIRRAFAFKNHPDRMPQHLRDNAIQRMQVANMLIDTARRSIGA